MKKIKTTDIVAGAAYPPSKKGLDFLQQSYQEVLAYVSQAFIGNTPSTTVGYVLYGCVKTSLGGSNYSLTAGAIYFNGEVYAVDAIASIAIATAPIMTITTTNDPTADPTIFTDGSSKNVHNIRKMVLSNGTLGTGTLDYEDLIFLNDDWHYIGATGEPAFQNSWVNNGGSRGDVAFKRTLDKFVYFCGAMQGGSDATVAFTLPAGYRPSATVDTVALGFSAVVGTSNRVTVSTAGDVTIYWSSLGNTSLENIRFKLD